MVSDVIPMRGNFYAHIIYYPLIPPVVKKKSIVFNVNMRRTLFPSIRAETEIRPSKHVQVPAICKKVSETEAFSLPYIHFCFFWRRRSFTVFSNPLSVGA